MRYAGQIVHTEKIPIFFQLPALVVFYFRNLLTIPTSATSKVMEVLLVCLSDENVEVRNMAAKALSGVVRCSQRQSIIPLKVSIHISCYSRSINWCISKNRFIKQIRQARLPKRSYASYAHELRALHSAILGLCGLIESFPYTVESWMPSVIDSIVTTSMPDFMDWCFFYVQL